MCKIYIICDNVVQLNSKKNINLIKKDGKVKMKKTQTTLLVSLTFILGIATGAILEPKHSGGVPQQIEVNRTLTESSDDIHLEKGDVYTELTDGSWIICNETTNTYVFQLIDLGDWNMTLETKQQLENCVKTYVSIKNTGSY